MEATNQTCRDEIKRFAVKKNLLNDTDGRLITAEEWICDQQVQAPTVDNRPPWCCWVPVGPGLGERTCCKEREYLIFPEFFAFLILKMIN